MTTVLDHITAHPDVDPRTLSVDDKVDLIIETDGLFVDILKDTIVDDLDLSGLEHLTHLPSGLHVRGNLSLKYCSALTRLPNDLRVNGHL